MLSSSDCHVTCLACREMDRRFDRSDLESVQVRDAAFLYRYNEPVLAVLHETHPGWAGRSRRGGKDNLALVAFSVNLSARRWGSTASLAISAPHWLPALSYS